jgi:hypothetical protein
MESIPMAVITEIIRGLGLGGIILIIWHFDNKRLEKRMDTERELRIKEIKVREEAISITLAAYREDVRVVSQYYKDNVDLVKHYESMSRELVEMVRLNTSAWQELTSFLKNKIPCYQAIRELNLYGRPGGDRGIE